MARPASVFVCYLSEDEAVRLRRISRQSNRVFTGPDHGVLDWALTSDLTRSDGTLVSVPSDCMDIATVVDDRGLVAHKVSFIDHAQAQKALAVAT